VHIAVYLKIIFQELQCGKFFPNQGGAGLLRSYPRPCLNEMQKTWHITGTWQAFLKREDQNLIGS
jgi:hypothetical protein